MTAGKVFIIAEAGVNHNGELAQAYKLVDAAKTAGADAVKFQTFKTENIVTRSAGMADYQKNNLGTNETQFAMLKKLELSYADFRLLQTYCKKAGIEFLSTPDDEESLDFLADELKLSWLKIGSGEVNNLPFLKRIAEKGRPIILSTGMSTLKEVEIALGIIRKSNTEALVVLHCTTNYPCPMNEVNLKAMLTLRDTFKVRIGYSDHTLGVEVPVAAVALGAEVIEKHFTLDKKLPGPDHAASLDPQELTTMVRLIRNTELALGNGVKEPNASEQKTKLVVRKRLVAATPLPADKVLTLADFHYKRSDTGIFAEHAEKLVGSRLKQAVAADTPLEWEMVFQGK